ncbi:hypothetical protein [Ralstonia insidiosa]|nr:hypothetical protein [Ralstonia insidiosa]
MRSPTTRLAEGYFSRHPGAAIILIVLLFGLAGAVAPAAATLLA